MYQYNTNLMRSSNWQRLAETNTEPNYVCLVIVYDTLRHLEVKMHESNLGCRELKSVKLVKRTFTNDLIIRTDIKLKQIEHAAKEVKESR